MKNKIIAAGVVVALCAVALIGVGYAYTATVTSAGNQIGSDYITIQTGTGTEVVWSNVTFDYNTETKMNESSELIVEYTSLASEVSGTKGVTVKKTAGISAETVTIVVTIPTSSLSGGYEKLFFDGSNGSVASIGGKTANAVKDSTNNVIKWTIEEVPIGSEQAVKLNCLPGAKIIGTLTQGPSLTIDVTFKAEPTVPAPSP